MNIKTIAEFLESNQNPEILFWIGCAGSYDDRYKKVRETLRKKKHVYLYYKTLAKNGHSYCENLKQLTINDIAISKLSK